MHWGSRLITSSVGYSIHKISNFFVGCRKTLEASFTCLTCVVEAVQHRGLPEVQFAKVDRLQPAAHRIAGVLQTLQGHALCVTLLARLPVHHVGHRHGPAFGRLPGGQQASAVHRAPLSGGADSPAPNHRVLPESPGGGDTGGAATPTSTDATVAGAFADEAVFTGTSSKARHRQRDRVLVLTSHVSSDTSLQSLERGLWWSAPPPVLHGEPALRTAVTHVAFALVRCANLSRFTTCTQSATGCGATAHHVAWLLSLARLKTAENRRWTPFGRSHDADRRRKTQVDKPQIPRVPPELSKQIYILVKVE